MNRARAAVIFLVLPVVLMLSLAGCATSSTESAQQKIAELAMLQRGVSTAADVRRTLGEPRGKGAVRLSVGSATIWFYDNSDMRRTRHLMVFMREDAYDGYLWLDSESIWNERR